MAVVINGSGTVTGLSVGGLPDGTVDAGTLATDSVTAVKIPDTVEANLKSGRKNLIINGAMQVWQRGTSATGLTATDFTTVDRFMANYGGGSSAGTRSVERSTDTPSGFNYSIKITHSGSSTVPNEYAIRTFLEMQDVKHLIGNTAVFSFYYKSNRTGTHAYRFSHNGITGASSINGEFTVNSADTWERKEIVITQLQNATGTATSDTSWGIHLDCGPILYGEGLASFDDGDYFAVTGVQLEVGSVATPFEHRSYGEELALCQRYYEEGLGYWNAAGGYMRMHMPFIVQKRTTPSVSVYSSVGGTGLPTSGTVNQFYQAGVSKAGLLGSKASMYSYRADITPQAYTTNLDVYWGWTADAEI